MVVLKAGTILLNLETKQIGLVYRKKKKDFSFPKGHLEKGETLQECAVRETEEETMRKNHLLSDKEIYVLKYVTPSGENVENYLYVSIDDGPTDKDIPLKDREEFHWFSLDETKNQLTYPDLKECWEQICPTITKIFSSNGTLPQ